MSQSAFFLAANCAGSDIELTNLNLNSVQGDKAIVDIAEKFRNGGDLSVIDASDIPDLVPDCGDDELLGKAVQDNQLREITHQGMRPSCRHHRAYKRFRR